MEFELIKQLASDIKKKEDCRNIMWFFKEWPYKEDRLIKFDSATNTFYMKNGISKNQVYSIHVDFANTIEGKHILTRTNYRKDAKGNLELINEHKSIMVNGHKVELYFGSGGYHNRENYREDDKVDLCIRTVNIEDKSINNTTNCRLLSKYFPQINCVSLHLPQDYNENDRNIALKNHNNSLVYTRYFYDSDKFSNCSIYYEEELTQDMDERLKTIVGESMVFGVPSIKQKEKQLQKALAKMYIVVNDGRSELFKDLTHIFKIIKTNDNIYVQYNIKGKTNMVYPDEQGQCAFYNSEDEQKVLNKSLISDGNVQFSNFELGKIMETLTGTVKNPWLLRFVADEFQMLMKLKNTLCIEGPSFLNDNFGKERMQELFLTNQTKDLSISDEKFPFTKILSKKEVE